MPSKYLALSDRVVRYVPWGKLLKAENDPEKVLRPLYTAFLLREDEEYLSATWCEYFNGDERECLKCAVAAIRESELKPTPKGHFAVATTQSVGDFMAKKRRLRFIHEREADNEAHVAIRGWDDSDIELLDTLAADVWAEVHSKQDIDAIAECDCVASDRGAA